MANVTVRSSTIAGNTATAAADLASGGNFYRSTAADAAPAREPSCSGTRSSVAEARAARASARGRTAQPAPSPVRAGAISTAAARAASPRRACRAPNPLLGPLGDKGGPTDVMLPAESSPAVNAALSACPAADQRGVTRPQSGACDIGAVEREVARLLRLRPPSYLRLRPSTSSAAGRGPRPARTRPDEDPPGEDPPAGAKTLRRRAKATARLQGRLGRRPRRPAAARAPLTGSARAKCSRALRSETASSAAAATTVSRAGPAMTVSRVRVAGTG